MKIAIATSSRSDFGLIRPIVKYFFTRGVQVSLVCLGAACELQEDYLREGIGAFPVDRINTDVKADSMISLHQTVEVFSDLCSGMSRWISELAEPVDWFLVPGDRFEIFASVVAAYYNNLAVAHIFGGDRSEGGHLDDNVRHAISKLAHLHFTVCEDSRDRILHLGEEEWRVHNVGSPVVESVMEILDNYEFDLGWLITPRKYNLLCTYHPITTESGDAGKQFRSIIIALEILRGRLDFSCIFTYPNNEFGSEKIVEELQGLVGNENYFIFETLGWKNYLATMNCCNLVIGNSSSALLEAPILGVPSLNIGTRQKGRHSLPTVDHVESYDPEQISFKIEQMLLRDKQPKAYPYGDGTSSAQIYCILSSLSAEKSRREILQKRITY